MIEATKTLMTTVSWGCLSLCTLPLFLVSLRSLSRFGSLWLFFYCSCRVASFCAHE